MAETLSWLTLILDGGNFSFKLKFCTVKVEVWQQLNWLMTI